jgi:hypothetical protein
MRLLVRRRRYGSQARTSSCRNAGAELRYRNGVPVTAGIEIINDNNPAGPIRTGASTSPSTGLLDYNIDGALCLRNLYTGSDVNAARVKSGINEVLRTANLHGKPAINTVTIPD